MSVGDQNDILGRLQRLIPNGWFSVGAAAIRDATLAGAANAFAFIFSLLAYVRLQTRIATATDGFLDLISFDFFGGKLPRGSGQTDGSFRNQITVFLFRQRNTREAVILVIEQLLGIPPTLIIEPQRASDCFCWDTPVTQGYDTAGVWGDSGMPLEIFVTITIPGGLSIAPPFISGYDMPFGAYDTPSQFEYMGIPVLDPVQAADIYAALDSIRPVTGVIWTNIIALPPPPPPPPPPPAGASIDSGVISIDSGMTMDSA